MQKLFLVNISFLVILVLAFILVVAIENSPVKVSYKSIYYKLRGTIDYIEYIFLFNTLKVLFSIFNIIIFSLLVLSGIIDILIVNIFFVLNIFIYVLYLLYLFIRNPRYITATIEYHLPEYDTLKSLGYSISDCSFSVVENQNSDNKEYGFYSSEFNSKLTLHATSNKPKIYPVQLTNKHQKIKKFLKVNQNLFIPFLINRYWRLLFTNSQLLNNKYLCLSDDINLEYSRVNCHVGSYFDTELTNCISYATIPIDGFYIHGEELIWNTDEVKQSISKGFMNNQIGISSLAFTEKAGKYYLILWKVNYSIVESQTTLASTITGYIDPKDLDEEDFFNTLSKSVERQLKETFPEAYVSVQSNLLGFFRWIDIGGQPYFVALSKISYPGPLNPRFAEYIDFENKEDLLNQLRILLDTEEKKDEYILTFPLYMNFKTLKDALESDISLNII
jgi:hypothetical protein